MTIFEKEAYAGGLNTDGIAPYKIQAEDAAKEIAFIESLGVTIQRRQEVGKDLSFAFLCQEYDGVFIGCGLANDKNIFAQKNVRGVYGAMNLIREIKMDQTFKAENVRDIVVIGGGNTALDVVQELALLDPCARITLAYRRTTQEMSGYAHELLGAKKLGVQVVEEASPTQLLVDANNQVTGVEFDCKNDRLCLPAQMVVLAIGQEKQKIAGLFPGVEVTADGRIKIDPQTQQTSLPKVYAGGDAVNGGKEVVNAVQHGKVAALHLLGTFDIMPQFGKI